MHNADDFFQYFSLDFKEADSAHHGSRMLQQAVFVNDAIAKIGRMYRLRPEGTALCIIMHAHIINSFTMC
jgi:hypothetical protein